MSRYGQSDGSDDWRQEQGRAANERKMRATIDQLKLELAQEKKVGAQLQRNIDYWVNQYNELHRQYMIKDLSQHLGRNTYEQGRADERTDIVEYLRYRAKQGADVKGWYNTFTIAWQSIRGGNHMKKVNDDESL